MNLRTLILPLALGSLLSAGCRDQEALAQLNDVSAKASRRPAPRPAGAAQSSARTADRPGNQSGQPPGPGAEVQPAAESTDAPPLTGTIEPHRRTTLSASVGGPVARVHVAEGQMVRRGAPLITVQRDAFQLGVRQAEAGLAGARVQLQAAKLEWERQRALLAEKAIAQSQYEMVDARYKGAQAAVMAAQVSLDLARKALRDAVVRAPFDGLVVRKHVSEGDYATSMPPTALVTVEEVSRLDLRVAVPAAELARVKVGDPVQVRLPSTGQTLRARVTRLVASVDARTRTFDLIVELPNRGGELRPGLFAELQLEQEQPRAPLARSAEGAGR